MHINEGIVPVISAPIFVIFSAVTAGWTVSVVSKEEAAVVSGASVVSVAVVVSAAAVVCCSSLSFVERVCEIFTRPDGCGGRHLARH